MTIQEHNKGIDKAHNKTHNCKHLEWAFVKWFSYLRQDVRSNTKEE
jgi:hypothetical protein